MAKVQYGGGITAITGSIGGWAFHRNRSGNIVRIRGASRKSSTPKQTLAHQSHSKFLQLWQGLRAINQDTWNTFADTFTKTDRFGTVKTLTGQNWFETINFYRDLLSLSILNSPPVHDLPEAVQDYNYAVRSFDILINFSPSFDPTDNALLIFTTPLNTRVSSSQRQFMRLTKIIDSGPFSFINITSDWETTHNISWPPSGISICGRVGIMIQTIKKSSGIISPALLKTNSVKTDQEGIGFMSISNDFIVKELFPYDPDAQILFDRMTVSPTTTRKQLINDLILGLKADGDWALLDQLVILASHDSQAALLDFKNLKDAAEVNAPAFEIDRGYTSDGSTSYINTQFNPAVDGVQYTRNNASFGGYSRTDLLQVNNLMGLLDVSDNGSFIAPRFIGNFFYSRINSNINISHPNSSSLGLFSIYRIGTNIQWSKINGVTAGFRSDASQLLLNDDVYFLCRNKISFGPQFIASLQGAYFFHGKGNLNHLNVFNRLETYLNAIGASVIL